ncbi:Dipeptidyl aminopeptidase/acylaminoacyl peptidase [Nocardioides scoriae]|uniref:Dipeptidyl aminopeptidase/acylaminoacyl peptidase n=1 Tax=Nocardioides scoriae TaxID=642780 RepID=A0A1H1TJ34_9ACTN|nr:prolyl oligopeptidase family serine peptidase [Nocardioides scoriae]SDS60325.1 Dipeptidyl aminopeptidase/acylaminoacyl peptidase [Nocardioides scoriae]
MAPHVLPFGSWPSPVSPADLVAGGGVPAEPVVDGGAVHWLTTTPESGARVILRRRDADGTVTDLSPDWMSVRSRVHEYGGGAYAARGGVVVAVDLSTQQLWRLDGHPRPLSGGTADAAVRWAAPEIDLERGVVVVVREDHRDPAAEPVNELVRLPLEPTGEPGFGEVVVPGRRRSLPRPDADDAGDPALPDFVADPALSPDGRRLAWAQWSHPAMPWDAATVVVADLDAGGRPTSARAVAGAGTDLGRTAGTPVWLDADRLVLLTDPDDRAVPHLLDLAGDDAPVALAPADSEHGLPGWQFRMRTLAPLPDGRVATARTVEGVLRLSVLDPAAPGSVTDLDLPLVAVSGLATHPAGLVADAGLVETGFAAVVVAVDGDAARLEIVATRGTVPDPAHVAVAEPVSWTGHAGDTAHGFLHRPTHPEVTGPADELPPLVVVAHGGPTSATTTVPRAAYAFFTSRGIAVLDVNYAGSTGYGRAYRERLRGRWGVADIEDVVAGARHLADTGVVDGTRMGVRGGSAGGYVVLAALAFHDTFSAGISYFGVSDPSLLAQETHKMESRYLDGLIGPWPAARATYEERSPLHHVDGIRAPLLLLQGAEDRVVPPSQAEVMAASLREQRLPVALVVFPGEGHGFRDPAHIVRAAEMELSFLGQLWGFDPADDLEPLVVENL